MVICPHCEKETDGSKKFCVNCGKELTSLGKQNNDAVSKEKTQLEKEKANIKREREKLNKERNEIFKEKKELDRQKELNAKQKRKSYTSKPKKTKSYASKPKQTDKHSKQPGILNKIVRLGIISITLLIILGIIAGALTFSGYLSFEDESISLSNPHENSNLDSISESDSQNEGDNGLSESDNLLSFGSTKNVDFDGLFTMDVDKDRNFEDFTDVDLDEDNEKHWYAREDVSKNEKPIEVYYWLGEKDYDFHILDHYDGPEEDGDLLIFTYKYINEDYPSGTDYLVFVGDDDEVVAIQGSDLDTLKDYANSVNFNY